MRGGDGHDPFAVGDHRKGDVYRLVSANRVQGGRDRARCSRTHPLFEPGAVLDRHSAEASDLVEVGLAAVPITVAPSSRACWSALVPTAPAAPWRRTTSPVRTPLTSSISDAVVPTSSKLAASGKVRFAGLANTRLADKCNLSRSAFSERFVRTVGQPPAAYIAQVRLEKAADLLQYTTDAVGAIAREIGYDSEAAFSRAFSKRHGMPPARWRRQPALREADPSPQGVK